MEEELKNLIEVLKNNAVPKWITIIGIFVPIAISIAVIVISILQHKWNKKFQQKLNDQNELLQRELSKKELRVQMHSDIMKIYDDFCLAQNALLLPSGKSHIMFSNFSTQNGGNLPFNYVTGLNTALSILFQAANRAMLLIPEQDADFRNALKNIVDKYKDLKAQIDSYYYSGTAMSVSNLAWQQMTQIYPYIQMYNYGMLFGNQPIYNAYLEKCKTETTTEIDKKTIELLELFKYENFDKYFEKYLRIDAN